jgi:DNA-binding PadR family transcriptional regulator
MGSSFAQEWPGRGPWAGSGERFAEQWGERGWGRKSGERPAEERGGPRGKHHHHHCGDWLFSHGGGRHDRPSAEDMDRLDDLIAFRRMRGGMFGDQGPFGRGGPRGRGRGPRRARRGDVRLALLRLLAEEPSNGYQLMQTIEERSGGRWRPSPGSVYPTLAQLEDEGLIKSTEADGSRRFELTDAGREHLQTRADEPAPWDPADEDGETAMTELGPLVIQIVKAVWQVGSVGDNAQRSRAIELLTEARRGLYRILAEDPEGPDESEESAG